MVWDIWWNGSNMWWNGLCIHSISSEWPSVEHKLYSYWCFHSSCNILAFCLPSFNSNDRSADKSICIIILLTTGYLKKYHKNIGNIFGFYYKITRFHIKKWPDFFYTQKVASYGRSDLKFGIGLKFWPKHLWELVHWLPRRRVSWLKQFSKTRG